MGSESKFQHDLSDLFESLGHTSCPLSFCISVLEGDYSTTLKKDAMSSIGRKRDPELKELLFRYTENENPEIAMQALRGLLVFKHDEDVKTLLTKFTNHSNDMIRDVATIELKSSKSESRVTDHAMSPDYLKNVVVEGNVLQTLSCVKDESIHLTFTSPPYYNARDYSIFSNYTTYLDFLEEVFDQIHRVTKEGRFFILNTSPVIVPRVGRKYSSRRYALPFDIHSRLARIGWEFIDDIIWVKPEKSSKNRISGFNVNRKPLVYKPNSCNEYVMVYRKKTHRLLDWNLRQYDEQTINESVVDDNFNRSNIWNIAPSSHRKHSAVFPLELCRQIIKLYSFKNDLIFDPFAGSGTLGEAAIELDRNFFLTEICREYVEVISDRLNCCLLSQNQFRRFTLPDFAKNIELNGS